jgi:hypothetical protein
MTEQTTTTTPQLTLNDFALVINIIDACTERGAFKGNEIAAIGQIREKFVAFVKANTPEEVSTTEENETPTEEA